MNDAEEHYLYARMRGRADTDGLAEHADPKVIDLGHDVRIMFTVRREDGPCTGLIESHPTPDGRGCGGSVTFDVPEAEGLSGPRWTVEQWDPLTISPSVLCSCGHHGFIRNGEWIPA